MQILILGSTDLPARREIFRRAVASLSAPISPLSLSLLPARSSSVPSVSSSPFLSPRRFSRRRSPFRQALLAPRLARGLVTRA